MHSLVRHFPTLCLLPDNVNVPELAKDAVITFLGVAVGLAGLLLVFIGFVYARGEQFGTKRGDRYIAVAKIGLIPFVLSLACAGFCVEWLVGRIWLFEWCLWFFRASLISTGLYGTIALLLYL